LGRYRSFLETTTNDFHSIDLAVMRRSGWDEYWAGTLRWSRNGHELGSIAYQNLPGGMRLRYASRGENINELIPFVYTATKFGGRRKWFECLSCKRRCRVIYGGRYFRCRKCYGARYPSQYEQAYMRYGNREQDIRERLGGSASVDDPFPAKPKWMRWKTYARMYREDKRWQDTWDQTFGIKHAIPRDRSAITAETITEAKRHSRRMRRWGRAK
jgi:hypothetical protein